MKIVSFEIAKAIKEAGYPQGMENTAYYNEDGVLVKPFVFNGGNEIADAPTYLEVWLWLWREKTINVTPIMTTGIVEFWSRDGKIHFDPEECIEQSIKHLVDNNLIK